MNQTAVRKIFLFLSLALTSAVTFFEIKVAEAFCPVCGVAVVGGLEISRLLGIDDAVTGLWIGAIRVILIEWTNEYLKKKRWQVPGGRLTVVVIFYAFVLGALYYDALITNVVGAIGAWTKDKLFISIV